MVTRINRNVEFLTDEFNNLTGYQRSPGDTVGLQSIKIVGSGQLTGLPYQGSNVLVYVQDVDGGPLLPATWNGSIYAQSPINTGVLNHVISGFKLPGAGALANFATAGAAIVGGAKVVLTNPALNLSANADNYVDVSSTGKVTVSPVGLGAAAPAVAANSMRLGFVKTGAATITSATQTGKDSLGNWMRNIDPKPCCILRSTSDTGAGDIPFGAGTTVMDNAFMHSESSNTSQLVVPEDGIYDVKGALNWAPGSNIGTLRINRNGADANLWATTLNNAATVISATCGGLILLNAGDILTLNQDVDVYDYAAYLSARKVS